MTHYKKLSFYWNNESVDSFQCVLAVLNITCVLKTQRGLEEIQLFASVLGLSLTLQSSSLTAERIFREDRIKYTM